MTTVETYECECGFSTNFLHKIEIHFRKNWGFSAGKVQKNGHQLAKLCGVTTH